MADESIFKQAIEAMNTGGTVQVQPVATADETICKSNSWWPLVGIGFVGFWVFIVPKIFGK